jgi:3D (Asp-Asp-Asp) domain-containing protein
MGYGTKIEVKTATVDGVQIEYWRAVQMYATSYSPCRLGTDQCSSGTASGKSLRKGMVGLRQSWYLSMQGQRLYIPDYGFASVEDVCGGCVGKPWIDLGFSDNNFEPWHSWVTVYFLTPVPANVIYVLNNCAPEKHRLPRTAAIATFAPAGSTLQVSIPGSAVAWRQAL